MSLCHLIALFVFVFVGHHMSPRSSDQFSESSHVSMTALETLKSKVNQVLIKLMSDKITFDIFITFAIKGGGYRLVDCH